jgi:hypothetical protein
VLQVLPQTISLKTSFFGYFNAKVAEARRAYRHPVEQRLPIADAIPLPWLTLREIMTITMLRFGGV